MRKAQGKSPARPGSGMLEVVSLGSETPGTPDVAVSTPQGTSRTVSSAPGTPKKTVKLLAVKRKEESTTSDLMTMASAAMVDTAVEADSNLGTAVNVKSNGVEKQSIVGHDRSNGAESRSSTDSAEEVDSESEDLHIAPNQMKLEFLDCIMKKDYQTAAKLCKMILIYEPSNEDALRFQSLIEEKIMQDAVVANADESSAESDSGDSEDYSDSDENEEDNDSDTSENDDDEQNESEDSDSNDSEDSSENDEGSSSNRSRTGRAIGTATKCSGPSLKK